MVNGVQGGAPCTPEACLYLDVILAKVLKTFMALCFPKAVYGLAQIFRAVAALHTHQVTALLFLR